jgi:manganese efflux pump family protein
VLPTVTLISWLLTAGIGAYMLSRWIRDGGVRKQRANAETLGPGVVFAHASLAITGLALWTAYTLTRWPPLAWSAVLVLMPAIGLGLSTVTLWTPYPTAGGTGRPGGGRLAAPAEDVLASRLTDSALTHALTDAALASRLVDEVLASAAAARPPRQRGHAAALIPASHGMLALTTFLLAVLSAVGTL